ncbi:hypothetical protein [Cylindrospermum sp. FACHB-282]|uniref:hypothetical protein n=1 Tax=Cylindrospermum sp. FACHB-282 TaxID=2692794 RepID=UPI0016856A55|nr:hypothetical protein [Cylindrospermum sp. FACHB-282]MBD2387665.1 hypothetical protein [Cylindrospermum sp. FACHB-282]
MQTSTVIELSRKNVSYQILTEGHLSSAIECLSSTFQSREPMTQALKITLEEFEYFAEILLQKAVNDQLSLVALDQINGKVVGVLIGEDFVTEPPERIKTVSSKFLPIFELLGSLDKAYKQQYPVESGQLYHIFMVGVYKEYAGLSVRLIKIAESIAHKKGYVGSIGESTGHIAHQINTKRLGFKEVEGIAPVYYDDFHYEGQRVFTEITECQSCRLVFKEYRLTN